MVLRTLRAGLLYFVAIFGAGFVLGTLRVLFLVPRIGVRAAELAETPLMLLVTWLAAAWVVRRQGVPPATGPRLGMGVVALALLLAAEFSLVLQLRGLTLDEYLATRDPVSAAAYHGALVLVALMPLLVERR